MTLDEEWDALVVLFRLRGELRDGHGWSNEAEADLRRLLDMEEEHFDGGRGTVGVYQHKLNKIQWVIKNLRGESTMHKFKVVRAP